MKAEQQYQLLQHLASPIVAITSQTNDEYNGMIANSAGRASLVPDIPRVSFYCFKQHYSHELISTSAEFCLHLLHRDQFDVIRALGFESGRETNKLEQVSWTENDREFPVIDDAYAWFQCRVINAMDAGPSTFFLGEAVETGTADEHEQLEVMDSEYFRENMPEEWVPLYRENKKAVQEWAREHSDVDPQYTWDVPR